MKPEAADLAWAVRAYEGRSYDEMDCQKFVERCLRDIGIREDLAGSNAWFRAMTWTGTPEECKASFGRIPTGAFLFILAKDGKEPEKYRSDGIGNASHIGIYTGTGKGAWHSSKSQGGVCESSFKGRTINGGWNRVGLWDALAYDIDIGEKEKKMAEMQERVTFCAANNSPINMRAAKNSKAARVAEIPQGETVQAEITGDEWTWVHWAGKAGYVKTEFLIVPGQDGGGGDTVTVPRAKLMEIMETLKALLS